MCANCGFPARPEHWTETGAADANDRARARARRLAILRVVMAEYGLKSSEALHMRGIHVMTATGRHVIASDLSQLWTAVEALRGEPVDPLDPVYLGDTEEPNP